MAASARRMVPSFSRRAYTRVMCLVSNAVAESGAQVASARAARLYCSATAPVACPPIPETKPHVNARLHTERPKLTADILDEMPTLPLEASRKVFANNGAPRTQFLCVFHRDC